MVIDSSAALAILLLEPDAAIFATAIEQNSPRLMSAATVLETALVFETRKGPRGAHKLDLFLYKASIEIMPFTAEQTEIARAAFRKYGEGRHPASLNFGDCIAYALSKSSGEPLLFKGDDFTKTDVEKVAAHF